MRLGTRCGVRGVPVLLAALLAGLLIPPPPAAATAHTQDHPGPARLDVDSMRPRVVTATGPTRLVITGRVVNTGEAPLSELVVRVQRDDELTDPASVRAALLRTPTAPVVTEFRAVDADLPPGGSTPFRLEVALGAGPAGQALQITEPGVYPLLINLNGTPATGQPARLASVSLLLPVLGVPAEHRADPSARSGIPPPPPAAPSSGQSTPLTMVWPLVAHPVRLPTRPDEPVLLRSDPNGTDPLLNQLAPGGRLHGLVAALEEVVSPAGPLADGLCVAVDPALLDTVAAMAGGYRVATPGGRVAGTGADEARRWLEQLRAAVDGQCVLALPYADPDLVALSRAGLTDLEALARSTGTRVVERVLGVTPRTSLSWPPGGILDQRTLADLAALGTRAVLLEPRALDTDRSGGSVTIASSVPGTGQAAVRALLVDPLMRLALSPQSGRAGSLPAQDAVGTLGYRALQAPGQGVLLVPPRRWQVSGSEATALLRIARELVIAGLLTPRPLGSLLEGQPREPTVELTYPGSPQIPSSTTARMVHIRNVLRDLQVATERDPAVDLEPSALLDPLRLGLLRAVSSAWRNQPSRATERVDRIAAELHALRSSVRIVPPSGPYTLTSSDSPLLVSVQNELPVTVTVTVRIEPTAGLSTGPVEMSSIPARSSRQLLIPAEVKRPGRFSVVVRLTTPGGTQLGQPTTVQLQSNTFDGITVALTGGAGVLLVTLVVLRIVRRAQNRRRPPAAGAAAE